MHPSFRSPWIVLAWACVGCVGAPPPPPGGGDGSGSTTTSSDTTGPPPVTTAPADDTSSTGAATETTSATTVGVSVTDDGTTSVDPSTSSSSNGESSSSGGPSPECVSDDMCGANEQCRPEGVCTSVCGVWGDGHYDYCLTPLGTFDSTVICGEALSCINTMGMDGTESAVCGVDCVTQCDCPPPPATGSATVTCGDLVAGGTLECYLACADDTDCPPDMACRQNGGGVLYCTHPVQPLAMYGDCGGIAAPCVSGTCAEFGGNAVCVSSCPGGAGDCDPAPAGADLGAACGQVFDPPGGNECHLPCALSTDCPTGMVCVDIGMGFTDFCMFS